MLASYIVRATGVYYEAVTRDARDNLFDYAYIGQRYYIHEQQALAFYANPANRPGTRKRRRRIK